MAIKIPEKSCNLGIRERNIGEIVPVRAEQSGARGPADNSLDLKFATYSLALPDVDGRVWLKLFLDQVYCVEKVVRYRIYETVLTEFTCSETGCACVEDTTCTQITVLTVYTEETHSLPAELSSNCKPGDRIKLEKYEGKLTVYEISVIGHQLHMRGEIIQYSLKNWKIYNT